MLNNPRRPFEFADKLLVNEQGMASDFTVSDGQGRVTVNDRATLANNVRNVIGDAFWSNAGTSPKLVRNSSGTLQWSPHNLVVQSQTFGTTWTASQLSVSSNTTTAPDGTATADTIVEDTTTDIHQIYQSFTSIIGATYTWTVYIKAAGRTKAWVDAEDSGIHRTYFDLTAITVLTNASGNTSSITDAGDGWRKIVVSRAVDATTSYFIIGVTTTDGVINYLGNGASAAYLWGAQVNRGTIPTTYLATTAAAKFGLGIDYDGTSYGLLVEPAATNLHSHGRVAGSWTGLTDITITTNNLSGPDGTLQADLATEGSAGTASLREDITIVADSINTFSFFAKRGNNDYVRLVIYESAANTNRITLWANLSTGATSVANGGTGSGAAGSSIALANGWYRFILTGAVGNGATALSYQLQSADADASTTRVNGATWNIDIAQAEAGTVATSPIPTFAATVTRARDLVSVARASFPFSQSAGSWVAHYIAPVTSGTILDTETGTERHLMNSSGQCAIFNNATTDANVDAGSETAGVLNKLGYSYAVNDFAGVLNGAAAVTDNSVSLDGTAEVTFRLGTNQGVTTNLNEHIRKIIYVPRRKTNAELQTATT